ncbi:hypothetical protein TNIN_414551 [Trichonephila inaurata madagascariensis]|uniref:Uncharacterized protein n=1 Tax=Trichonephila inaurata madagascariensis TaxID=2747483 RepID=A0A8X6YYD1_9ARAC|nr:hypothetical protein TNIN_414551 [Trichonephila inaurata madagascariensis]
MIKSYVKKQMLSLKTTAPKEHCDKDDRNPVLNADIHKEGLELVESVSSMEHEDDKQDISSDSGNTAVFLKYASKSMHPLLKRGNE